MSGVHSGVGDPGQPGCDMPWRQELSHSSENGGDSLHWLEGMS